MHFTERGGSVMAGGMAYSALFSGFAALWVFFSVVALVFANSPELMDSVIEALDVVPGLIGDDGVIKPDQLTQLTVFGWTGAIALVGALWTAIGWIGGTRTAIRNIFDVPTATSRSFVLDKLLDLVFVLAIAVGLVVSVTVSVASTSLLRWLLSLIEVDSSVVSFFLGLAGLVLSFLVNLVIVACILTLLSGLRIPRRILLGGAGLGALGILVITQLGSLLIGGASRNPFLASFAVLIGVLIFANLVCTIILISASWVKVWMDDAGASPRLLTAAQAEKEATTAELRARRDRLAADRIELRDQLNRTPRFRRSRIRRRLEEVDREQRRLEREDLARRIGLDDEGGDPRADASGTRSRESGA
nr:YhjD/YihY/BrkB family envelope integrity protein [Pseudoclavibacter chungangensis]